MTRRRVIASNVTGPTNRVADAVMTATTSSPRFASPGAGGDDELEGVGQFGSIDHKNAPILLDILDLFTHLLQLGLRGDDELRHAKSVRLRSHGVHLPVHFLQQEVEFAPTRLGAV